MLSCESVTHTLFWDHCTTTITIIIKVICFLWGIGPIDPLFCPACSFMTSSCISFSDRPCIGLHSSFNFFSFFIFGMICYSLSQQDSQTFASCLSCLQHTPIFPSPQCVAPLMNLNLVPQQLPSIILASTANSSPASHFSPLKKPFFPSLQRWNCLACLPGKWFLSRLVTLVLSTGVCVCACIQGLSYICVSKCLFCVCVTWLQQNL